MCIEYSALIAFSGSKLSSFGDAKPPSQHPLFDAPGESRLGTLGCLD